MTRREAKLVDDLVKLYIAHQTTIRIFQNQVLAVLTEKENPLAKYVHSFRWRMKDPEHLREKLIRKIREAKAAKKPFLVNPGNLFGKVNDLVGFRILHLHTRQITEIDKELRILLKQARYCISEKPFARTWDDETREFFDGMGIKTQKSGPSMYTSVHYIIDSNSQTRYTAKIQVRTLAEELWGEVSHAIDYPDECSDVGCREQIRVLARVTSSCSRLVDAIFRTHKDFVSRA